LFMFLLLRFHIGGIREKHILEPYVPDDSRPTHQENIESAVRGHSKNVRKIEWKSYADLPFQKPTWLIKGLIPAKSLVMLYGFRGQGKTFVALDIAASIASGLDCLGCKVESPGRVGYLLAERPEGLKRRLAGWLRHREAEPKVLENVFVAGSGATKLDNPEHLGTLIKSMRAQLATPAATDGSLKLLVIDPLAAHMEGSENEANAMTRLTDAILELSETFQCSILLVHHEGKNNFNNRFGARGSSALEAALDTVLWMAPPQKEGYPSEIRMTKQREFEEAPHIRVTFKSIVGTVPDVDMEPIALGKQPLVVGQPIEASNSKNDAGMDDEIQAEIISYIKECALTKPDDATVPGVHERIRKWTSKGNGRKHQTLTTIREHLSTLARSGRIIHLNPGKKPYKYGPAH
jgi:hypothetical protein